jgi:hypothetical protein
MQYRGEKFGLACCLENGCTGVCELQTSFCCPGGYQLTGCYAS